MSQLLLCKQQKITKLLEPMEQGRVGYNVRKIKAWVCVKKKWVGSENFWFWQLGKFSIIRTEGSVN